MGMNIMSTSGHTAYGIKQFVIDTVEDLKTLPIDCVMGSAALCLENGEVYFFSPNQEEYWVKFGRDT